MKNIEEFIQENYDMIKERISQLDRLELIQDVRNEMERAHLTELVMMLQEFIDVVSNTKNE